MEQRSVIAKKARKRCYYRQKLAYALFFTLTPLLLESINFLGMADSISNANQVIYQRIHAIFYSNKTSAQDKLAVVLYTDRAAQLDKMRWPMRMDEFANLIDDIAQAQLESEHSTKGIFINLAFRSSDHDVQGFCELVSTIGDITQRPGQLLDAIGDDNCLLNVNREAFFEQWASNTSAHLTAQQKLQAMIPDGTDKSAVPVIIAAPLDYLDARQAFMNHLLEHRGKLNVNQPLSDPNELKQICKKFTDSCNRLKRAIAHWPATALLDLVAVLAPVNIGADNGRGVHLQVGELNHLSPPWLIASSIINQENNPNHSSKYTKFAKTPDENRNLYIQWGGTASNIQPVVTPTLHNNTKCPFNADWFTRFTKLIGAQAFPSSTAGSLAQINCPHHLTIDAVDYYDQAPLSWDFQIRVKKTDNSIDTSISPQLPENLSYNGLKTLINGKFVLIGLSMSRFSNYAQSPVHGSLAGVHTHAIAVDNLLKYGDNYYQTDPGISNALFTFVHSLKALNLTLTFLFSLLIICQYNTFKQLIATYKCFSCLGIIIILALSGFIIYGFINAIGLFGENNIATWKEIVILFLLLVFFVLVLTSAITGVFLTNKNWGSSILKNLQERGKAIDQFAPHVFFLSFLYACLFVIGTTISWFFRIEPVNTLFSFISLSLIYLLGARDDIQRGFTKFIMNDHIAEHIFGLKME